ncbi:MAG TPA: hypothetical protein VLD37_06055 [Candidatus Bilamarchaeum sp.]|nr:hypothetical protein [Candidatus Bilamarchaeum sp.]
MAQTQVGTAQAETPTDGQLRVVRNLTASRSATDTAVLSGNAVRIWEVREIVRGERPASGDAQRVYDQALTTLGGAATVTDAGTRKANALRALDEAMVTCIQSLNQRVQSRGDAGDNAAGLERSLVAIQTNSQDLAQMDNYSAYRPISTEVSTLLANVRRATVAPADAQATAVPRTQVGVSQQMQVLEPTIFDIGRVHYFTGTGGTQYFAVGRELSPNQLRSFADQGSADRFIGSLSNALAARLNGEAQNVGTGELLQAMNGVSNPQMRNDPHFRAAMDLLRAGQRDRALDELRQIGPLYNGIEDVANHQTLVVLDNRAVTVFSARATVAFDLAGSMEDFTRWLRSDDPRAFGRAVVQVALTAAYDYLRGSALVVDTVGGVPQGTGRREGVTGHAVSVTPSLSLTTSAGTTPIRVLLHCNFGYLNQQLDRPIEVITPAGTRESRQVGREGAYLGFWGAEVQFPPRPGSEGTVRVVRAGAGVVGTDLRNALGYMTLGINYTRSDTSRWQMLITPMYSGFYSDARGRYEPRPGLEIEPLTWMQQGRGWLTQWSILGARAEYNTATNVWTFDLGTRLEYQPHPAHRLSARLGYIFETGPESARPYMLQGDLGPGYLYGGIGYQYTFGAGSRATEGSTTVPRTAVPVRVERESPVQRRYRESVEFVDSQPAAEVTGTRGQARARELAGTLQGYFTITAPNASVTGNAEYQAAIRELEAGHLREGLEHLANVPGLQ